jgi:hypothetical protein
MKVTKDIVRDLLPAYLAGEASAETRAAVEAFLAQDAELREIVETAGKFSLPPLDAPVGLEGRSLKQTRRLLGRKNFWLGFALIFCLAAPIVKPLRLADVVMVIGIAGWVPFFVACKKLMAIGVTAKRGWGPRHIWGGVGAVVTFAIEYHVRQDIPWRQPFHVYNLWVFGLVAAQIIGAKLRQIQTPQDASSPYIYTLFGKQ